MDGGRLCLAVLVVYMGMGFVLRFAAPNLKMVAHPIYREISFWISFIRFFCAFLTDGFEIVKSTKKGSCFVYASTCAFKASNSARSSSFSLRRVWISACVANESASMVSAVAFMNSRV